MTMTDDEPQFTSLKERIAALKLQNGGPSGGSVSAPAAPVPAATKWIPADPNHHSSEEPNPPAPRKVPARPPVPGRPVVPPPQEEADEEVLDSNAPAPARRHYSATRLTTKFKQSPPKTYQRLAPPPAPTFDDDGDEDPSHTPPLPIPRTSSSHSSGAPALPRRASATSAASSVHSDTPPPPPSRRPSDAPPAAAKRTAPPLPGSRRPGLPASVFIKGGAKPKPVPAHAPEVTQEPELEPASTNGRKVPPTIPGRKAASSAGDDEDDEPPATSSVASRIAALGRQGPIIPGGRPPLPTRTSGGSEETHDVKKPPVPATTRPPVPSTARPPLPSSQRPSLPVRSASQAAESEPDEEEEPAPSSVSSRAAAIGRRLPPSAPAGKPPPVPGLNGHNEPATIRPTTTGPPPIPGNRPPPVPMASRPRTAPAAAAVDLSPAPPIDYATAPRGCDCLMCRDFSGPDKIAAQYPLSSLPRDDPVGYLAAVLCKLFPSPTDKARAIFTWCHHNIAYDVDGFFGGCIPRGQSTAEQIWSGKAVCEGYANIFLAIAQQAGLEAVKISGHGKGYGFSGFKRGDKLPEITGHAWNAVRIDGGEWKLVDSCWGAGHVSPGKYTKRFEPLHFHASNEEFGLRHYPDDRQSFFRADGVAPSWESYLLGPTEGAETPEFYSNGHEEGFDKSSLQPEVRAVDVASYNGGYVRFLVSHICEHWDGAAHGPGPMYPINLNLISAEGKMESRAMETDGFWYWIDVPADELGRPGDSVFISVVTQISGESARGKGNDYYKQMKGKAAMSFTHIVKWDLV